MAQLPLESGWVTVTVVAVTGPLVEPLEAGVPVAVTQSPTATSDTEDVSVWVKVVEEVQLTVTWPLEPWTSIDVPAMDATVPDADGTVGLVEGADVEAPLAASWAEDGDELQAAANNARAPKLNRRPARRKPRLSRCRPLSGSGLGSVVFMAYLIRLFVS